MTKQKIEEVERKFSQLEEDEEFILKTALEKSLSLRELGEYSKAIALLSFVINSQCPSSLRLKAMIHRAELYLLMQRKDLATRQLEALQSNGGEWALIAEHKLQELYGHN